MKYVYIKNNIVQETIREVDPAFPDIPLEARYTADFLAHCVAVPDDTRTHSGMIYNPEIGVFSEPEIVE